jgi:HEPN domain-containing protein
MTTKDRNKLIKYWLDGHVHDLKTALSLKKTKNYPYALFFLHLSLEKLLKAIIVTHTEDQAPFGHNLPYLLGKTKLEAGNDILEKLQNISKFNLEARYPDINKNFYNIANKKYTEAWFKSGQEIIKWLIKELNKN